MTHSKRAQPHRPGGAGSAAEADHGRLKGEHLDDIANEFSDVYPDGYLRDLRGEWPE